MKWIVAAVVLIYLLFASSAVFATEEIASKTGHECGYCHLDPTGGGELTSQGKTYLEDERQSGRIEAPSIGSKVFHLAAGYLHLLFAVLWFGTILYVHIVLKPSYAEKGLPRGEKFVGVLSFWVVGITGTILAVYRVDSLSVLFETRFGILLTIKIALYLTMLASAMLVIKIIGPRLARHDTGEHVPGQPFTRQTLHRFSGDDGQPVYFAYKDKVYDASGSRMWAGGKHMRRHSAGEDLTAQLAMAPHDDTVMERLPVVGDYAGGDDGKGSASTKAFYFVAYMNLVIVFLILFIIALWRWA